MRHHRVDETRQSHRVTQVRRHLTPLREGPRHYRGRTRREGKLEQPKHQVVHSNEEEVGRPDECLLRILKVRPAVCERVADRVEAQGRPAGVQQVLEHAVLHVLQLDTPRAEHGEAGLHEEHQRRGVDQEEDVDRVGIGLSDALQRGRELVKLGRRRIDESLAALVDGHLTPISHMFSVRGSCPGPRKNLPLPFVEDWRGSTEN